MHIKQAECIFLRGGNSGFVFLESWFLDLRIKRDVHLFAENAKRLCKRDMYWQKCGMEFGLDIWLVISENLKKKKEKKCWDRMRLDWLAWSTVGYIFNGIISGEPLKSYASEMEFRVTPAGVYIMDLFQSGPVGCCPLT